MFRDLGWGLGFRGLGFRVESRANNLILMHSLCTLHAEQCSWVNAGIQGVEIIRVGYQFIHRTQVIWGLQLDNPVFQFLHQQPYKPGLH